MRCTTRIATASGNAECIGLHAQTRSHRPQPSRRRLRPPARLGELIEGYGYDDILQVDVNGLAVRAAPFTSSALAVGYRLGGARIGPVRLDAGAYVSVDLGPLVIGDTTWYRVWLAENAELHYSTILWDTKNDGPNPIEPGWIAASVGDDEYVSLFRAGEPQDHHTLLVSGIGNYESRADRELRPVPALVGLRHR